MLVVGHAAGMKPTEIAEAIEALALERGAQVIGGFDQPRITTLDLIQHGVETVTNGCEIGIGIGIGSRSVRQELSQQGCVRPS